MRGSLVVGVDVVVDVDVEVDDETSCTDGLDSKDLETTNATTMHTENVAITTSLDEIGNVRRFSELVGMLLLLVTKFRLSSILLSDSKVMKGSVDPYIAAISLIVKSTEDDG